MDPEAPGQHAGLKATSEREALEVTGQRGGVAVSGAAPTTTNTCAGLLFSSRPETSDR